MNRGLSIFAGVTAGMTLVLILAGGFVTSTQTGDTIPTWPHWWGRLAGGAWVEWTHRAVAGVVGLLVATLALWVHLREPRTWLRRLALVAFAAVVVQALLGGMRVFLVYPKAVAVIHATFAQVIFCAMIATALFLSRAWREAPADEEAASARKLALMTTLFAFLQLVAGAVTRHTGAGIAVHLAGAGLVFLHAALLGSRLMLTTLQRPAVFLLGILFAQVALGLATWSITRSDFSRSVDAPLSHLVTVTGHVAVGALLLATSLVITLRCWRLRAPEAAPALEAA